ncbi:hypothetical protein [Agromyces soli]|uniref:Uncharacterized protein n=1 Tax=Agromyces soli TaxID=659012 RepID=A0ABY4AWN3_9MICO|nr:hypothetical protein [Agromyces soli]UOE27611.1 hypothetical protein MTP13_07485 [Agromyces soli]
MQRRRSGFWRVVRALFASLAAALDGLGGLPPARPEVRHPEPREEYRP